MATTLKFGNTTLKARVYAFPSRGNQPEDYFLLLGSERLDNTRARTTKGKEKEYTYIKTKEQMSGNQGYYVEGVIPSGSRIELIEVVDAPRPPKAPKAAAAPAPKAPAPLKKRGAR
jgi:hypothetical protein